MSSSINYEHMSIVRLERADQRASLLIRNMRDLPAWKTRIRAWYEAVKDDEFNPRRLQDTFFGRHHLVFSRLLRDHIFPSLTPKSEVELLNVGIGGSRHGSSEPWELVAHFLGAGFYPRLKIIEEGSAVIDRFRRATTVVSGDNSQDSYYARMGERDVAAVYQYGQTIASFLGVAITGEDGAFSFPIPVAQRSRIREIKEVDVTLWEPAVTELGLFSLAVMINVTNYIKTNALPLAFMNVYETLRPGGYLLISESYDDTLFLESPLMQRHLGYRLVTAQGEGLIRYLLLQKNSEIADGSQR